MRASDIFKGKSLKAEDIEGKEPIVTIMDVTLKTFDDNTTKPVISFKNTDKTLVCNKTNWNGIVEALGGIEDSDEWTGKRIKLVVAKVDFQGKRVKAIRVEPVNAPRKPEPVTEREPGDEDDTELGF